MFDRVYPYTIYRSRIHIVQGLNKNDRKMTEHNAKPENLMLAL